MLRLSKFASGVRASATLAAGAKARELRAQGAIIFDFSLGEPDQPTPAHICRAAEAALAAGHTHYTPAGGIVELRKAVSNWYRSFHGWDVPIDRVVISNGAKHALHNALVATVGPGDDVLIPDPCWVSYEDLVMMTGATPVHVATTAESGFKLSAEQYRAARTPKTRLILLNSPCNPTGTVYTRAELESLVDTILETDVAILSDEIYEQLCYAPAKPTCIAALRPEAAERTITVSGASKSYAMTGWRAGWGIAPPHIAASMTAIQSQETGCPSSVSQYALLAALQGPQDCIGQMRQEYQARRKIVCDRLSKIPGVKLHFPDGAFYAFFDVSQQIADKRLANSAAFCVAALAEAHVNLVPGSAFNAEGYVRMSYATSRDQIEGGLAALEQWLGG